MDKIRKPYYITLITIVALMNLILVFNNNVWCDEAFVLNACKFGIKDLLNHIMNVDMRPPLYLVSAKVVTKLFGLSATVLKIFSLVPAVLGMILGATVVDRNWGNDKLYTGTIYILLNGLVPLTVTKNIEISMYSWVLFFISCSAIYAYNIVCHGEKKKDWIIFTITSLGAAAMHYYAVLAEIFIYLFLYIALLIKDKRNFRKCLLSAGATILGYTPILPFFLYQFTVAKEGFWIEKSDFETILAALRMAFEGENRFVFSSEFTMLFWALILGLGIKMIIELCKNKIEKQPLDKTICFALLLLLCITCFLLTCLILSALIRPLFIDRYMYVVVGLLWTYVAIVFGSHCSEQTEKNLCIGLLLCMILFGYPTVWNREYKTNTDTTVSYLNENMAENDILINNIEECTTWVLNYYFPEHRAYLNVDEDSFYKNALYDFSQLDSTAWYICYGPLDIPADVIEREQLQCEYMLDASLDNYYYFSIYKISRK